MERAQMPAGSDLTLVHDLLVLTRVQVIRSPNLTLYRRALIIQ